MVSNPPSTSFRPHIMERITDPLAVVVAFTYLMFTKYTAFELTQDELLWGFMSLASVRGAFVNWYANRNKNESKASDVKVESENLDKN